MTPQQIALVRATWKQVEPIATQAAGMFYERLFALDPALRSMFKGDMSEQGQKLMTMIGVVVTALDDLTPLMPAIHGSGSRHAGYGVKPKDYETVGSALLWTLKGGLGEAFTTEVESAWTAAYSALATVMKDGAAQAA